MSVDLEYECVAVQASNLYAKYKSMLQTSELSFPHRMKHQ